MESQTDRLLDQQIAYVPLQHFLDRAAAPLGIAPTPLAFALYFGVDPAIPLDLPDSTEQKSGSASARNILIFHVNDPDDGRDATLYARTADGNVQQDAAGRPVPLYDHLFFMGGPETQAYRHMEKPPVSCSRLESTWGYPFGELGMASDQAQRYFTLSRLARAVESPYWEWRFLACAVHYLQDLAQPYHATQMSSHGHYFWRALRVWLMTPHVSLRKSVAQLMQNSHQWYESYVASHSTLVMQGLTDDTRAEAWLVALRGETTDVFPWDTPEAPVRAYAKTIRDASNRIAPDLLTSVYWMSNAQLLSAYPFDYRRDPPDTFLRTRRDLHFMQGESTLFAVTTEAFARAARATRTLVQAALRN
ncbi:MAG: hypothetical protein HYV02_03700 [Deltaproteobacteria bacterium]|nr:hypothetical protein [Deltaproteobacteria bacterium]